MSRNKTAEWHPLDTAPKDGTELIFWVSSQKGFQDTTASFYCSEGQWRWADTLKTGAEAERFDDTASGCSSS